MPPICQGDFKLEPAPGLSLNNSDDTALGSDNGAIDAGNLYCNHRSTFSMHPPRQRDLPNHGSRLGLPSGYG